MTIASMSPGSTLPNGHSLADVPAFRAAGGWATETLATELRRHAGTYGDKLAVASMDASITYAELDESADRLAASLVGLGLRPGDPAVFQLGNEVETVVALFGVLKAGLTPVCAIPNHGAYEIGHIVAATQAKLHLFQTDYRSYDLQSLSREISAGSTLTARVAVRGRGKDGALSMHELIRQSDPDVSRATVDALQATLDPDSTAVYQLSGGTTGVPKVIAHPQPAYSALARHWAANLDWDSDIVSATFLPVMHNAGLATALLPALLSGGSAVICRSADPAGLADVIARHRVNWLHFSMAAYRPLLDYAAHHDCDFSSVTHFTWTLIRPEMSARAEELLGAVAVGSCGMGEGILLSARRDDSPRVRRETVGAPIGPLDRVRVFRPDTEEEAADGELGELIFSGPTVVRSYLCPAEANSTGFTSDGALRSGDLGRAVVIDGRRCFTMEGRLKDQIVRGGEKFMAEELEVLLTAHPSIREVAVVGVPDARLGERVGVFVVCNPGKHDPGREELVAFLRDRGVAKFKWPEQVVHVDALPKSGIGKVQKTVLRRQLTA